MEDNFSSQANHKKLVEQMVKKTHFTEGEVERLLEVFAKSVVRLKLGQTTELRIILKLISLFKMITWSILALN